VFDPGSLGEVHDVEGSKALDRQEYPSIIVSASGMITGGRVLHHLSRRLPDPRNTVILVGFQAAETRGRLLAEGARTIKMLGRYVPVRAEIVSLPSFSVHADHDELVAWLDTADTPPDTSTVHGERARQRADATTTASVAPR
jgi:metallo-beta-lactamase family protein